MSLYEIAEHSCQYEFNFEKSEFLRGSEYVKLEFLETMVFIL